MTLISRKASLWICGLGMVQLLFATGLTVCGFIVMGLYRVLDCKGIWAGLPMMVPALLSVVVLGTRHRAAGIAAILTGIIVLIFSAYHVVVVWEDIDFWEKYKEYAESNVDPRPCYNRGDQCICADLTDYLASGYTVPRCDLFRTGYELFWTLIGLTIGGILFTILTLILTIWGCFTAKHVATEEDSLDGSIKKPPQYENEGLEY